MCLSSFFNWFWKCNGIRSRFLKKHCQHWTVLKSNHLLETTVPTQLAWHTWYTSANGMIYSLLFSMAIFSSLTETTWIFFSFFPLSALANSKPAKLRLTSNVNKINVIRSKVTTWSTWSWKLHFLRQTHFASGD